ncbi:LysE/ArgO family amino acid transporter [Caldalkalibacillus salinus]|uniref:LysE/ArgO family amino acid transporter n=1 Tax=Caldalkalibacillus salinus TaxID=2803787 RepID=UPI00192121D5|nr:LysE/ArgO family amino acid transporter [Caldalkalibacillus salinus]
MLQASIHGAILALGLILPLGVQNVFIFNQGATQKTFFRALPAVITASLCDTLLILLAVLGVSVIVLTFAWLKVTIYIIGVLFLGYMGWVIWRTDPSVQSRTDEGMSIKKQVAFAASVSLLNPHAIMDTIGVIGTNSLSYTGEEKVMFSIMTILVSWIWFLLLAVAGRNIGKLDATGQWMRRINVLSAIIIWGVAFYMIRQLLHM